MLIDEISLAEDAVLERLNSVLEPQRKLLVAERSRQEGEVYEIVAQDGFALMATMNPGGALAVLFAAHHHIDSSYSSFHSQVFSLPEILDDILLKLVSDLPCSR